MAPLLFLSHAGADADRAVALAERIEKLGLEVWLDRHALVAGDSWLDQIEKAIKERSTAFAILVTGNGPRGWVALEVRAALERVIDEGNRGGKYPFIPLFTEGFSQLDRLPPFARQYQGISLDDDEALPRLVAAVRQPAQDGPVTLVDDPFVGLEALTADDSHLFFGREQEVRELLDRLKSVPLVMVVGDSGSGKSSLVRAGLIPAYKDGQLADPFGRRPDRSMWHIVEMRPLRNPFESLVQSISRHARDVTVNGPLLQEAFKRLRAAEPDPDAIKDALREGAPAQANTLLVVDQFEELWTQTDDARARKAFLDGLARAAELASPSRRVVATIRRDYYFQVHSHDQLKALLEADNSRARYNLRRMKDARLRECIEKPLALAGISQQDRRALADEVLRDVGDEPGDLALVAMALFKTWQRHGTGASRDLIQAYREIGRVEGALGAAAEQALAAMGPVRAAQAETIFMRLVTQSVESGPTRRLAQSTEFTEPVWRLAQDLAARENNRLLVIGVDAVGDTQGGDARPAAQTAELAHEQLATQWPKYQTWLRSSAERVEDKRILDRLMERAAQWNNRGRHWGDLATSTEREEFTALEKKCGSWLAPYEKHFIRRSQIKSYAAWGAALLLIVAGVFAAYLAYQGQRQQLAEANATILWNAIGDELTGPALDLNQRPSDVKLAFAQDIREHRALAKLFMAESPELTRAIVGLDPGVRQQVIDAVVVPPLPTDSATDSRLGLAVLATELQAPAAVDLVLRELVDTKSVDERVVEIAEHLASLRALATDAQKTRAVEAILRLLPLAGAYELARLCRSLVAFETAMTSEQISRAVASVVSTLHRSLAGSDEEARVPDLAVTSGLALENLVPLLLKKRSVHELAILLETAEKIDAKTNGRPLRYLWKALGQLETLMSDEHVRRAVQALTRQIAQVSWTDRSDLAKVIAQLGPRIAEQQRHDLTAALLQEIERSQPDIERESLVGALGLVAPLIPDDQKSAVVKLLMIYAVDPRVLHPSEMVLGLMAMGDRVSDTQVNAVVDILIASSPRSDFRIEDLVASFGALTPRLSAPRKKQAMDRLIKLLTALSQTLGLLELDGLTELARRIDTKDVPAVSVSLVEYMPHAKPEIVLAFCKALIQLPSVSPADIDRAADHILTRMSRPSQREREPSAGRLGEALAVLAPKVTQEEVVSMTKRASNAMSCLRDRFTAQGFSDGLAALAARVDDLDTAAPLILQALTNPFSAGEATDVLVTGLRSRLHDGVPKDAGLWSLAAWSDRRFGKKFRYDPSLCSAVVQN